MKIILGLGNPGPKYAASRHNAGFGCVDCLARRLRIRLKAVDRIVWEGVGQLAGEPVVLAKPRTFMNLSGKAGRSVLARHGGDAARLVVVHDDVDLPLGTVRVKHGGGHGGHNGLRSLLQILGDPGFMRIRLGVGRPEDPDGDLAAWVLAGFRAEERVVVERLQERGADAVEAVVVQDRTTAMNRFNVSAAPPAKRGGNHE